MVNGAGNWFRNIANNTEENVINVERDGRNYEFNWRLQNCYALVAFNYMFLVPWNWYVVERKKKEEKKLNT